MPARLQIKAEDCSPLGRFILDYLAVQGLSMNRLAELSGVPQPRLRGACFKGTCPTPETLRKLAQVMGKPHLELYTLAYEGRLTPQPEEAESLQLDQLLRALRTAAHTLDLTAPAVLPSSSQLCQALFSLGFRPAVAASAAVAAVACVDPRRGPPDAEGA